MKKVLIALDYDPSASFIAAAGYHLAKAFQAKVLLLHVVADPVYYSSLNYSPIMGFDGFQSIDTIQAEVSDELEQKAYMYLDRSKEFLGDEDIETLVSSGDFADAILQTAQSVQASVIVMGAGGKRGTDRTGLGSVTENVLQHSAIPLFIIPTKKLETPGNK